MTLSYILVLLVALGARLLPIRKAHPDFDTYGHLYYAHEVKQQRVAPWGSIKPRWWGGTEFRHPFLWHKLVGIWSIQKVLRHQRWINGVIDALFALLLFWVSVRIGFNTTSALLVFFLYLFSPIFFSRFSTGPRVGALTPRLASEVLFNVLLIVSFLEVGLSPEQRAVACVALISVIFLTTKFGLQAVVFLIPVISVLTQSWAILYWLVSSVFILLVVSRGAMFYVLKEQINHLRVYYHKNKKGLMPASNRNNLRAIVFRADGTVKTLKDIARSLLVTNSYTSVLIKFTVFPISVALICGSFANGHAIDMHQLAPCIAGAIAYFFTNRQTMLFLGEGERYLTHTAAFILLNAVSIANWFDITWLLWAIVAIGIAYWLIETVYFDKLDIIKEREYSDEVLVKYLQSLTGDRMVLSYPYTAVGVFRILIETQHRALDSALIDSKTKTKYMDEYEDFYPFMKIEKIERVADLTQASVLIVRIKSLKDNGHSGWIPSSTWRKVSLDQPMYQVYER
jgi:hypothetical protein